MSNPSPKNIPPSPMYDYTVNTPGFLRMLPSAQKYLASWGMNFDTLYEGFRRALTNRMAGYTSDGGNALIQEFSLPADERLTSRKWLFAELKGTSACIFEMMHDMGHDAVSIYNNVYRPSTSNSRTDSPYFSQSTYANIINYIPANIFGRYDPSGNGYTEFPQFTVNYNHMCYTVVVWDAVLPTFSVVTGISTVGYMNEGDNLQGVNVSPQYESVMSDICRLGGSISSTCVELVLAFQPSASATGGYSKIDTNGNPVGANDIIEYVGVDRYRKSTQL